jgi:hypothetical protein
MEGINMPKLCRFDPPRSDPKYVNPMLVRALTWNSTSNYTIVEFDNQHTLSLDLPIDQVATDLNEAMTDSA